MDWISETGIYEKFLPLYHMSNRPRSLNIFPSNEKKSRRTQKEDLQREEKQQRQRFFFNYIGYFGILVKKMPNAVALLRKLGP